MAAGAVYLYRFDGTDWFQQAYLKASNTDAGDTFGSSVALSADGNTLAVGAKGEASNAIGINGSQTDNSSDNAGAVYLFRFEAAGWYQQAYIKASNTDPGDLFGSSVALAADGNTLAVGARWEDGGDTGIDGDATDNSAPKAGAIYVFHFTEPAWFQQAYLKASNTDAGDTFGSSVALSADGNTLAAGAWAEDSGATGVDGNQANNSSDDAGAAYLFRCEATDWLQQAYVKASNTGVGDQFFGGDNFGYAIALNADGNTLAVGADGEESNATGINGDQTDRSLDDAGALYLY